MDLTSDHPFWLVKNGLTKVYPPLDRDIGCDVAIVGAGISGALIAHRLAKDGLQVVVLDGRDVCLGSTSASTALLQYEIDVPLVALSKKIGHQKAERAYRLSHQSIDELESAIDESESDCGFERKTSIYVADDDKQAELLKAEANARNAIGINVDLIGSDELKDQFSLDGTAAIVSRQAASCDPYRFAHGLLASAVRSGAQIFDRTEVKRFNCSNDNVQLETERGPVVTARHVVVATGYEAQTMLKAKVVKLKSTYALVSQPLESLAPWDPDWIMWEAKDPYLYLRATSENRLLVGGEDDDFRNPVKRDASLPKKVATIKSKVTKLLPSLEWEVEFAWAGTFGETDDGLAYIGPSPEYPGCHFALGFGGNGITFSSIAAGILADLLTGRRNADAELFRFGR